MLYLELYVALLKKKRTSSFTKPIKRDNSGSEERVESRNDEKVLFSYNFLLNYYHNVNNLDSGDNKLGKKNNTFRKKKSPVLNKVLKLIIINYYPDALFGVPNAVTAGEI